MRNTFLTDPLVFQHDRLIEHLGPKCVRRFHSVNTGESLLRIGLPSLRSVS